MRFIHIALIAAAAAAFSPVADAQERSRHAALQAFATGLTAVRADIQVIQSKAAGERGPRRPTRPDGEVGAPPYEIENDVLAAIFCNEAADSVGKAEAEANAALTATTPSDELIHYNSACMLSGWAVTELRSTIDAALTNPIGNWLTVSSDLANVTAKLKTVRATAACP